MVGGVCGRGAGEAVMGPVQIWRVVPPAGRAPAAEPDVAGNPAMTPFVDMSSLSLSRTTTNLVDNLGDQIYDYQATLPSPVALDEATTYYLSLVNNTGDWDWVGSGPGTHWARPAARVKLVSGSLLSFQRSSPTPQSIAPPAVGLGQSSDPPVRWNGACRAAAAAALVCGCGAGLARSESRFQIPPDPQPARPPKRLGQLEFLSLRKS
jgi:hypothetical protein